MKKRKLFTIPGALLSGALAGLFFAPKKGEELRKDAKEKFKEIKEKTREVKDNHQKEDVFEEIKG